MAFGAQKTCLSEVWDESDIKYKYNFYTVITQFIIAKLRESGLIFIRSSRLRQYPKIVMCNQLGCYN